MKGFVSNNKHMMRCAIIGELDMSAAAGNLVAMELNRRHPSRNAV
jgi:hypothetical protein